MKKIKWFFFDFDGTLVDSLPILYNIYNEFLKEYGFIGNKYEFNRLNGPSLSEIVSYLKNKYNICKSEKELLKKYNKKVYHAYKEKILPFKESNLVLEYVKNNNYKLALISSGKKKCINTFIKKNKWNDYFSAYVLGEEVKYGKPYPDIYKLACKKAKTAKNKVLVIEDSYNGLLSAKNAGLECFLVGKNGILLNDIKETILKYDEQNI